MPETPSVIPLVEPVLQPGRELLGQYRIVSPMGRQGGMGALYKAENKSLKGLFHAVKVQRVRDVTMHELFEREAATLCKLTHPSVVSVQNYGKELEDPLQPQSLFQFIVMEYLVGETLDEVIGRRGQLTPIEAVTVGARIAEALKVIHEAGIVHRDLKPANVMLKWTSDQSRVVEWLKVIDLGLALTGDEQSKMAMGTPEYIAPEQARNQPATPSADIYALGVMLFQMASGALPYAMPESGAPLERITALLRKHMEAPVPRLRAVASDAPIELDELVFRMMQKRAEERPPSAAVVARELGKLQYQLREGPTQMKRNPLVTGAPPTERLPMAVVPAPFRTAEPDAPTPELLPHQLAHAAAAPAGDSPAGTPVLPAPTPTADRLEAELSSPGSRRPVAFVVAAALAALAVFLLWPRPPAKVEPISVAPAPAVAKPQPAPPEVHEPAVVAEKPAVDELPLLPAMAVRKPLVAPRETTRPPEPTKPSESAAPERTCAVDEAWKRGQVAFLETTYNDVAGRLSEAPDGLDRVDRIKREVADWRTKVERLATGADCTGVQKSIASWAHDSAK